MTRSIATYQQYKVPMSLAILRGKEPETGAAKALIQLVTGSSFLIQLTVLFQGSRWNGATYGNCYCLNKAQSMDRLLQP